MKSKYALAGVLLGLVSVFFSLKAGVFYQTGQDWFETCWAIKNTKDAKPASAKEAVKWAQCESVAYEAIYGAGFVMTGNPENAVTEAIKSVYAACPSGWSDLSLGYGEYGLAVDMIEKNGGPRFIDSLIPPHSLIQLVYETRWPDCNKRRIEAGYPRIAKKSDGAWGFESECAPCKLEQEAAASRTKSRVVTLEELERELSSRQKKSNK